MTWADVTEKFMTQSEPVLDRKIAREIAQRVASIDTEADVRTFAELL